MALRVFLSLAVNKKNVACGCFRLNFGSFNFNCDISNDEKPAGVWENLFMGGEFTNGCKKEKETEISLEKPGLVGRVRDLNE